MAPNGQTTTTSYDGVGWTLSNITKNSTGTTTYGYDGLNRLTQATEGATVNNWASTTTETAPKPPRPRVEPPDLTERERAR
jgi:hypothetical protein